MGEARERGIIPEKTCEACGAHFTRPVGRSTRKWLGQRTCGRTCSRALVSRDPNRFWAKVEKSDGCWLWTGNRNRQGYGQFLLKYQRVRAHRHAWALTHGPIPADVEVCHTCDNPACVRPDHLFLGTHAENMGDMRAKGRRRGRNTGPGNGRAKLTRVQVNEIRELYGCGGWSHRKLAARFGVDHRTIGAVIRGRTW